MGKFTNMKVQQTVDTLTDGFKNMYSNPYYALLDKGKTNVTYLSQSEELSTLDEGNLKAYADRGNDSPIKFNQINNVMMLGLDKIILQLEMGEFGIEANEINGEATMLPGLVPKANDYFFINHYKNDYLFKVTGVNLGTPEVESIYSITYRVVKADADNIMKNVVNEYEMIVSNYGTQYNAVLQKVDFDFVTSVEYIIDKIKEYYFDLFYNQRVESFILEDNYQFIYDPVLTEFIIRNKLLYDSKSFVCFTQQMFLEQTFSLEYDKTFFRCIETNDIRSMKRVITNGYLEPINQPLSILSMRPELYNRLKYGNSINSYMPVITTIDIELIKRICSDETIESDDAIENIIINYMNGRTITKADIETLEAITYTKNKRLFYLLPIVIYVLEYNANKIVKSK